MQPVLIVFDSNTAHDYSQWENVVDACREPLYFAILAQLELLPFDYGGKYASTPVDIPDFLCRLNAFFVVTVLQDYLLQPIPPRLAEELAYILHFRDESGEVLALLGYCAEEMATANIRS